MLWYIQQLKLRLSPFKQHGVPFTFIMTESNILMVNVPVASLQLFISRLLGYRPFPKSFAGPTLCKSLHNVGTSALLGYGKRPKSRLLRKLEAGDRDIYREYISYCHYRGRKVKSIERRRKMEFLLLYEK